MAKLTEWLQKWLTPFAAKLAANKYISSLTEAMLAVLPLIMVGSLACLIASIGIDAWQTFLTNTPMLATALTSVQSFTTNLIALYVVIVLSYKVSKKLDIEPVVTCLLSTAVFFMMTPAELNVSITQEWLSYKGMIAAIIFGMVVPSIVKFINKHNWTIKMPDSVPQFVQDSFSSIIPVVVVVILAQIVNCIVGTLAGCTLVELIYKILQIPFSVASSSLPGTMLFMFGCALMMSLGIHANTLLYVVFPLYVANGIANMEATAAGTALPNIVTSSFFIHIVIGGIGCVLPLVVLLCTVAKSKRLKTVGKIAIVPNIFNITEPALFGAPILFNPILMIPYILTSVLNVVIGYLAIASGIVPHLSGVDVLWSIPTVISGFLAQGWQFALLQAVLFVIDLFIWLPFVKAYDKQVLLEESKEA